MEELYRIGKSAKAAARIMNNLGQIEKNEGLKAAAEALMEKKEDILEANKLDVEAATAHGMKDSLIDRLRLTEDRINKMAEGIFQIIQLEDPVGEVLSMKSRPNGLQIGEKRVPLGVIGIIYESRPNVTADAFALCFKTGNGVILRGGSDALHSNKKIVEILKEALEERGFPGDAVQLLEDTSHETAEKFMKLNAYVDVLIPRGGARLIKTVVENSTIPVIETGTGNCHIFVDETADINMAVRIIENAKTQRMGVCNACESLVIHEKIAKEAIPEILDCLSLKKVEVRGDKKAREIDPRILAAKEEDWGEEYLEAIISLKIVSSIEEAIAHINTYNTGHSESIITKDYGNSQKFLNEIDAAAVYVNASTRFTDGYEFGFGAEIGISTQKLHARGPMGLKALTTTKYIIYGNGQIRE
ncbi:MAG: glutamate-5-semialdehyde dehydrogenase [Acetivibrio sp.]